MDTETDRPDSSPLYKTLRATDRVIAGGRAYIEWCADLVQSRLDSLGAYCCQGIVVPQLGEQAGEPLSFVIGNLQNAQCVLPNTIERITTDFWEKGVAARRRLNLDCHHGEPHLAYVFAPMAHGFDRPVGCLGAIVPMSDAAAAETQLDVASSLLCVVLRSEKASHAIELLAQPIWTEATTTARTAKAVASACRRALSCLCVIVWQTDADGIRLKTLAVDGPSAGLKVDMRIGEGVAGKCAQDSRVIVIDDFDDLEELARVGIEGIANPAVVKEQGWRSAIFVPLDIGDKIAGVISAYGPRPKGFSKLDLTIALAFAQRLTAGYVHASRIEHLSELERKLSIEAPAIEAGILAMERVHDVDNNLTLAQGQLSIIGGHFRRNEDSPIKSAALKAAEDVDLAHKEIKALVSRSRMERIVLSRFDLCDVLREAIRRQAAEAADHRVHMVLKVPPKQLEVRLDREGILRVMLNLLGNAIYWLSTDSKGGQRRILVSAEQTGATIEIRVEDNGPGIAYYHLGRVFEYFFTTRGERGMGFGLPIARRFVERLGGSITVESRWGYSTKFKISVPADAAGAAS